MSGQFRYLFRFVALCAGISAGLAQAKLPVDLAATLQVGGWQEREEVTTNHKGKVTDVAVVWMGVVSEEMREGEPHVWLEMRSQQYKMGRGGARKPRGKPAIMKTMVPLSAFNEFSDPSSSMRRFGKEIIFQADGQAPMRIREGGMMADMMLKSFGGNMEFAFDDTGTRETVEVPAGSFDTIKMSGRGSMEVNMVIRKMRVDSETLSWFSEAVPMGVVKQDTQSTTNGKVTHIRSELLRHGDSGAQSMINDAEVEEMPAMNFPGLDRG